MNKPGAFLQAIGGHLIDLYRMAAFDVRNPHSLSKFRNIDAVRRRTGARMMVETGTFRGVTAARCARVFEKVYTIELEPTLAREAREYLRQWPNVEAIEGDGLVELPKVLARDEVRDVLVFLDGHFSGGVTAHGDMPEPAVLEVEAIAQYREKIRAIVIDDFRCFGKDAGMPSKADVFRSIENHFNDGYEIAVHLDQVLVTRL